MSIMVMETNQNGRDKLKEELGDTVSVKIWNEEGAEPIVLRCHITTYPFFTIQDCPRFFHDILHGNPFSIMATYEPISKEWQHHEVSTVRKVDPSGVILYCALPSGIAGGRIWDCPHLAEEIALLHGQSLYNQSLFPFIVLDQQNRRWPANYSYAEIVAGIKLYELQRDGTPAYSPSRSFKLAFPNSDYLATTFRRHYKIYQAAEQAGCHMYWNGSWESYVQAFRKSRET